MERRPIPVLHRAVSWAGFALPLPGTGARSAWRTETLSRAVGAGIDLFDCRGAPAAEIALGLAVGGAANVVCLTDLDAAGSGTTEGAADRWEREIAERTRRAGASVRLVPLLSVGQATGAASNSVLPTLRASVARGGILGWGVRIPSRDLDPQLLRAAVDDGAAVLVGPYSLLERDGPERALGLLEGTGSRWIATDPFAAGALDGSWLAGNPLDRDPGQGPMRLGEVRASAEPVLALAYLTRNRRRTLPEAALRFPLLSSGVASVLAPLDRPTLLDTVISAEQSVPFDADDLHRLRAGR